MTPYLPDDDFTALAQKRVDKIINNYPGIVRDPAYVQEREEGGGTCEVEEEEELREEQQQEEDDMYVVAEEVEVFYS